MITITTNINQTPKIKLVTLGSLPVGSVFLDMTFEDFCDEVRLSLDF